MSSPPSPSSEPHERACPFCAQGLLRYWKCSNCDELVLLCDECELVWRDLEDVEKFGSLSHRQFTYPECPSCAGSLAGGRKASVSEIAKLATRT